VYYIDESGSIPTFRSKKWANRYFVISFVHTKNANHLERVFSDSLRSVYKYYPEYFADTSELKGSAAPPFVKEYLLRRILRKTDIKIGYIIADNWNIQNSFRQIPSRSFNYLIKLVMMSHALSASDRAFLNLKIDNRNSAVESLKSLEEYLFQELVLGEEITNKVHVEYCDSCNNSNIQVADLVANTVMQYYRYRFFKFPRHNEIEVGLNVPCPESAEHLYNLMKPKMFFTQMFPGRRPIVGVALA
jgi:hypothetical protein